MKAEIYYYFWASFHRKIIDKIHERYRHLYHGTVLDVGGRDRGKFKKPKKLVTKWIFADIEPKHNPDIVLDIADMHMIDRETIDVLSAIQIFCAVEKIELALNECHRVLKKDGHFLIASPFIYPVVNDPTDYQRWTRAKWILELQKRGFKIEVIEDLGHYFTVMADFLNLGFKATPWIISKLLLVFRPLLSLLASFDNISWIKKNPLLSTFTMGYFIVARK